MATYEFLVRTATRDGVTPEGMPRVKTDAYRLTHESPNRKRAIKSVKVSTRIRHSGAWNMDADQPVDWHSVTSVQRLDGDDPSSETLGSSVWEIWTTPRENEVIGALKTIILNKLPGDWQPFFFSGDDALIRGMIPNHKGRMTLTRLTTEALMIDQPLTMQDAQRVAKGIVLGAALSPIEQEVLHVGPRLDARKLHVLHQAAEENSEAMMAWLAENPEQES